jgi:hypothetical protein
MDIINNERSKTTIFILPLLYLDYKFTEIITKNFSNCYICNEDKVIIKYDNNIVEIYISDELINDYKKIIRSKYSKISDKSKQRILNFWNEDETSYLYSILYKTIKILNYWQSKTSKKLYQSKDKEYWPRFNINEESLKC